ncbi:zinc finger protein 618-like isoform X2 [Vanacampus margaritifer]
MDELSVSQEQVMIHKSDLSLKVKNKDPCVQLKDINGKSPFCAKFARIECYGLDTNYVACKTCSVPVKYTTESGTSGLIRHKCHTSKAAAAVAADGDVDDHRGSPKLQRLEQDIFTSLAAKVARMCSEDLWPLSAAEGRGFVGVAQTLLEIGSRFGYKFPVEEILPSSSTIARHVDQAYYQLKGRVKDEIQQCQAHALSADLWTAQRAETRFLTLTTHYIHEWKSHRRVLATREVAEDDDIKRAAEEILQEFGMLSEDVVVVTDDSLDAAFHDYTRLSCAGSQMDSILRHVFDCLDEKNPLHAPVIKLMAGTDALVTHLKRERLEEALAQPLQEASQSSWHPKVGTLKSVQGALKSGELRQILLARNELRFLEPVDGELLDEVVALLAPFDEAKRHLSARVPTLHLVLPTKVTLLKALLRRHGDSQVVTELKVNLSQAVDLKFQIDLYHKMATALSPSLRSFLRRTVSAREYDEVIGTLAQLIDKSQAPAVLTGGARSAETSEVDDFFAACIEEDEDEDEDEDEEGGPKERWGRQVVQQYMSDKIPPARSLLDFWKERSGALVPLAKKFLSVPASGAPAEPDLALGRRRAALHPHNVDALLFLHSNMQM